MPSVSSPRKRLSQARELDNLLNGYSALEGVLAMGDAGTLLFASLLEFLDHQTVRAMACTCSEITESESWSYLFENRMSDHPELVEQQAPPKSSRLSWSRRCVDQVLLLRKIQNKIYEGDTAATDRLVLEAAFRSLHGASWHRKDNWCSDEPLGSWFGVKAVTRNGEKRVVKLQLSNNNLTGHFPDELCYLSKLEYLDLSKNGKMDKDGKSVAGSGLTGTLPNHMQRMRSLKTLNLCNNSICGSIPSGIREMFSLQVLDLDTNCLSGVLPLELTGWIRMQLLRECGGGCDVQLGNNRGLSLF